MAGQTSGDGTRALPDRAIAQRPLAIAHGDMAGLAEGAFGEDLSENLVTQQIGAVGTAQDRGARHRRGRHAEGLGWRHFDKFVHGTQELTMRARP
jgi:hypothetical protein